MIALNVDVDLSQYTPRAAAFLQLLGPRSKKDIHDAAATEVVDLLRDHIRKYAATHHTTADNITGGPAPRTGHLEKAADSVAKGSITAAEGSVTISSPGFRRALEPITIVPKTKSKLTVPVHARAYGKTVADLMAAGTPIFRPKGRDFLATTDKRPDGAALIVLYALKDSVTLKHDPAMLPTGDEFCEAVRDGVLGIIQMRFQNRRVG